MAAKAEDRTRGFEIRAILQADYVQDFRRVDPLWKDTLRPSTIPTQAGQFGSDGQAILGVRPSNFGVKGWLPLEGKTLKTDFNFDLFGQGDQAGRTTLNLQHAYGEWGSWLAGQTDSLFMDGDVFPDVLNYWGPPGIVFMRNPQIRWTPIQAETSLAIGLELPVTDIDPGEIRQVDPAFGKRIQSDEKLPDLTVRLRRNAPWGHLQLSAILRRIGYETLGSAESVPRGYQVGWGFDLGMSYKTGRAGLLTLAAVFGRGISSYINDGGTDLAPDGESASLRAKAVPIFGWAAFYDLRWSERWSSCLGYSRTQVENARYQEAKAYFRGDYASVNLVYKANQNFMTGVELLWGGLTDRGLSHGEDLRAQLSFRYTLKVENP